MHTEVNVCNYSAKSQIPAHTWTACVADSKNSSNLDLDLKMSLQNTLLSDMPNRCFKVR